MLRYAIGATVIVTLAYALQSWHVTQHVDKWSVLFVAAAAYTLLTTAYLLYEVTRPGADLGQINHEKTSIGFALILVFAYLFVETVTAFTSLKPRHQANVVVETSKGDAGEWIYRTWGAGGNCEIATTVSRGPGPQELTISSGSAHDTRRIIGVSTANRVETSEGIFVRQPDGSMTSNEAGMEDVKLIPCAS